MKRLLIIGLFIVFHISSYAQNLDLIVKISGDSIACRIDSITDTQIYFEVKVSKKWIHTYYFKNLVKEFQYGVINEKLHDFAPGTSYIKSKVKIPQYSIENIQNASLKNLELYLVKAQKLKKTGAVLSITGPISAILGILMFNASWAGNFGGPGTAGLGFVMFLGGTGVTLVGLPILITGSSRIRRINKVKESANGLSLDIAPCSQFNLATQNHQLGVTLRIRF